MSIRSRLFNFIFFRSMLTSFGNRSPYSANSKVFDGYFQYKIGPYQPDYNLYFAKQPSLQIYKNEIFNKMYEYSGYDLIHYLEFHYEAYDNKADFIRFLHYEVSERLKRYSPKTHKLKLQATSDWLEEKKDEYHAQQEKLLRSQIELDVRSTLDDQAALGLNIEATVKSLSEKLASRLEQVVLETQDKMTTLTDPFPSGNIELNTHTILDKLVQLFILVLSVKAPGEMASEDKLFKRFSATDLASILHLHFLAFKDKKFNTVQVKITEYGDKLKINNPKVQNLNQALEAFFY
jgi:hypothetical protein